MSAPYRVLGMSVPVTEALDPALWRTRYAHGLLLGAMSSEWVSAQAGGDMKRTLKKTVDEIKPEVIRWHLRTALSELEVKLGVPMGIIVCKALPLDEGMTIGRGYDKVVDRLPFINADMNMWWKIPLPPGVISIERIRSYFWTSSPVVELSPEQGNLDLVRLEPGAAYIFPTSLTTIAAGPDAWALTFASGTAGNAWWQPYNMIARETLNAPEFWAVDYTVGPRTQEGGEVGHIEAVLADWVYCIAAQKLLPMAAMAVTRGVSGSTISMDGVSRNVPLANGGAIYDALARVYKETTERIDWKAIAAYKRGIGVLAYS